MNIVAEYDYTDEAGQLLFQTVRLDPKDFLQRHRNGNGWAYNLNGCRRVLYRLPKVLAAKSAGKTIFKVEGEKDVESLEKWNLVATTAPMGAKAPWREEYTQTLAGARVVVLPDNDPAGIESARACADTLAASGCEVRLLDFETFWPEAPVKADITDWIETGGTKETFFEAVKRLPTLSTPETADVGSVGTVESVESLPAYDPWADYEEVRAVDVEPMILEWIVPQFLHRRGITIMTGKPGGGKSTFGMELTWCFTMGEPFLGQQLPAIGKVLWIDKDMYRDGINMKLLETFGEVPEDLVYLKNPPPLNLQSMPFYEKVLTGRAYDLIIIDTLAGWLMLQDMDATGQVQKAMAFIRKLLNQSGAAMLAIGHPAKGNKEEQDVYAMSNSLMFAAMCDVVAFLISDQQTPVAKIGVSKGRYLAPPGCWANIYDKKGGRFYLREMDARPTSREELLYQWILGHPNGLERADLLAKFNDVTKTVIDRHLDNLVKTLKIEKITLPGTGNKKLYRAMQWNFEAPPHPADIPLSTGLSTLQTGVEGVDTVESVESQSTLSTLSTLSTPTYKGGECVESPFDEEEEVF